MKRLSLVLVGVLCVSACSTAADMSPPEPVPAPGGANAGEAADAARIEQDGPSAVPRDGWVETVSGWYRSTEACLQHRRRETAGTPLSVAEECLEPGT